MRSARWILPGMYSRPAEPMPFTRPRLAPGSVLTLPTRKSQALLAYLALPPGRAHPRDELAALLWGGIRDESARLSLRQALFGIRRVIGEIAPVRQDGDALALDPAAVD